MLKPRLELATGVDEIIDELGAIALRLVEELGLTVIVVTGAGIVVNVLAGAGPEIVRVTLMDEVGSIVVG